MSPVIKCYKNAASDTVYLTPPQVMSTTRCLVEPEHAIGQLLVAAADDGRRHSALALQNER